MVSYRILESFVVYGRIKKMLLGIDSTGFGYGQASYYYTKRLKLRRKFLKIAICADMNQQLVCGIRIRHRWRNDGIDFVPLLHRTSDIIPVGTVVADRGFDSEQSHVGAGSLGITRCIIRPR